MNPDIILASLGSIIAIAVSVYTAIKQGQKTDAETSDITIDRKQQGQKVAADSSSSIVATALSIVDQLRLDVTILRQDLTDERKAREQAAADCQAEIQRRDDKAQLEIAKRDAEITILKREINNLNRQQAAHDRQIRALKSDTDELALRTPPPPNFKDRSTFLTDIPPVDEPPNE